MSRALPLAALIAALAGCDPVAGAPEDVESDIVALRWDEACVGLRTEAVEVRAYAAERLVTFPDQAIVNQCLCTALFDPATGVVDPIVAAKIAKSKRDDLAACLAPAVTDARTTDRAGITALLADIRAPSTDATLAGWLASSADPGVRAAAAAGLARSTGQDHALTAALGDTSPEVRVAAARALYGHRDQGAIVALGALLTADDPTLRGAAAASLASMETLDGDLLACKALLDDESDAVRAAPLAVWQTMQARRVEVTACLAQKLGDPEPSAAIREAVIVQLRSAATVEARNALCDEIGAYTKANVGDAVPEGGSALDLIGVQNAIDYERTHSCVQRALGQGPYTCAGRYWLAKWMVSLGGHASAPKCEGMAADAEDVRSRGPQEFSFE